MCTVLLTPLLLSWMQIRSTSIPILMQGVVEAGYETAELP